MTKYRKKPVVAQRLQALIERLRITQAEFASEVGTTPAAVSQYLSGDRVPQTEVILRICERFEVSADWLIGISNPVMSFSAVGYFSCPNCDSKFKIVERK